MLPKIIYEYTLQNNLKMLHRYREHIKQLYTYYLIYRFKKRDTKSNGIQLKLSKKLSWEISLKNPKIDE
jgi:hypothetical protein